MDLLSRVFGKRGPSAETIELVSSSTIADVLELVDSGELSAAHALEAEQQGRQRKGLLDALTQG